jgi:2-methylfumaryl-CoA hydratase
MVRKRDKAVPAPEVDVPTLPRAVDVAFIEAPVGTDFSTFDPEASGSAYLWDDYAVGEKIDHVDGVTIEESEHMMATRLYQNTAKVHFNQFTEGQGRFGRRLIYGGHVISLARSLSFNGLGNAQLVAAINGGRHVAPCFAGDTVFAWSEVVDKAEVPGRVDLGAPRLRTTATKNLPCSDFPGALEKAYADGVILELDYWVLMPRS